MNTHIVTGLVVMGFVLFGEILYIGYLVIEKLNQQGMLP